jgi:phage shock protein PspC (stress-responsive transcriptional regulator)
MGNTFYRDKSRGIIAGVCAGLAEYFAVSPVLLRLIFVLLAFSGGAAVPAYIILWIVLPEKGALGVAHLHTVHDNLQDIGSQVRSLGHELQSVLGGAKEGEAGPSRRILWLGAILTVIGLVSLADAMHLLSWVRADMLWAMALILAGVVMLSRALRRE